MQAHELSREYRVDFLLLMLVVVVVVRLIVVEQMRIFSLVDQMHIGLFGVGLIGIGYLMSRFRIHSVLSALVVGIGMIILALAGAQTSAAAVFYAGRSLPLFDDTFDALDKSLGFDWLSYLAWVQNRPWFEAVGRTAYTSIFWQPLFLVPLLALYSRDRMFGLVATMTIGLIATTIVAAFLPCLGPYAFHGVTSDLHPLGPMETEAKHVPMLQWLRAGAIGEMPSNGIVGLISFPSYHSTSAILYIWACWRVPLLKWVILWLNLMMLTATPTHGSHYLVDIIAGCAIAYASILVAEACFRSRIRVRSRLTA